MTVTRLPEIAMACVLAGTAGCVDSFGSLDQLDYATTPVASSTSCSPEELRYMEQMTTLATNAAFRGDAQTAQNIGMAMSQELSPSCLASLERQGAFGGKSGTPYGAGTATGVPYVHELDGGYLGTSEGACGPSGCIAY